MGGACGKHGGDRNAYGVLVTPHEGQEPLNGPRHRWKDNIKVDLKEMTRDSVDWIHLAQHMDKCHVLINTVMNIEN
jgi:hypothetical protein